MFEIDSYREQKILGPGVRYQLPCPNSSEYANAYTSFLQKHEEFKASMDSSHSIDSKDIHGYRIPWQQGLAWNLWIGILCSGSWDPETGGTARKVLGEPGQATGSHSA